jgi:uncharacterized protein YdhG (YjbR/CyaY superfamily)
VNDAASAAISDVGVSPEQDAPRMATKKKPSSVDEYIAAAPKPVRAHLKEMRKLILAAAPGCTESLKWSKPAFSYRRILVVFGAFRHHVGFFITPAVKRAFEKELEGYKTASSSVQLPYDKPLPKALVRKITAFRAKQERSNDAKWRVEIWTVSRRRPGIDRTRPARRADG